MILKPYLLPFGAIEEYATGGVALGCDCRSRVVQPIQEATLVQPLHP